MSRPTGQGPPAAEVENDFFNMSMDHVPQGWVEAQQASPLANTEMAQIERNTRFQSLPTRHQSPFIPNVIAMAAAFITGATWYFAEILNLYRGPWSTVGIGVVIGLAVRLSGMNQPPYRAFLALSSYLLTVLIVLILITRRDLSALYGGGYGLREYEEALMRTRVRDALRLATFALGAILATQVAYFARSGR